jgi:hypothetical protein
MTDQEPSDQPNPYDAGRSDAWNQPYGEAAVPADPTELPDRPTAPAAPTFPASAATPPPPAVYGDVLPAGNGPDLLSNGTFEPGPPARRRNVAAIVLSLVAVLAVIVGGVACVGYHKLASKGAQPDGWVPANAVAYVKLDLDPSAAEKVSALQFEQKFPSAPRVTDAAKLKDALLDAIFSSDTSNPVNYATDVKPWLGSRVALAVYVDGSGKAQPVGILEVTDAAKAKAGLAKLVNDQASSDVGGPKAQASSADGLTLASDMPSAIPGGTFTSAARSTGYVIEGDYAIVASSQQAADAAAAAAKKSNISGNSTYTADVATLKGDRVVTAWTDLGALLKLADSSGRLGGAGMLVPGGLGSLGGLAGTPLKGRAVAGVSIHSDYAELEGRILGSDVSAYSNPQAGTLLKALPSGSVAGISVSGYAASAKKQLDALLQSPLLGGGAKSQLDAIGSTLGIAFPDDVLNLLGNDFAVSLDAVPTAGASGAKLTAITEPTDAAKGLDTAKKLAAAAGAGGFPLTASADGTKVVLTNEGSVPTGSLGSDAGFKSAMSGMPDQVVAAAYVNLAGIWDAAPPTVPADVKHLAGLGMYAGIDGSDFVFSVRLTIK